MTVVMQSRFVAAPLSSSSGGGSRLDLTTIGTVGGSAKGAAAGSLIPTLMSDGTRARACQILKVTQPCTVDIYIERVFGDTGTTSVDVATVASLNVTAGTHYTTLSTTVTATDSQRSRVKVSVPILAIPTGAGVIAVHFTGTGALIPYAYIWLQGTGHAPGAKFLASKGAGVDSAGDTSGNGSSATPWKSLEHACSSMTSGGFLYVRNNASYKELISGDYVGMGMIGYVGTAATPLIILPDPDNVGGLPVCDNGETANLSNAQGICIAPGAAYVWICGWEVTHGNITTMYSASSKAVGCVILANEIHDYKINGSNGAGIRFDHTSGLIMQDNYPHDIYSTEGGNSNEYTAVASSFHEGAEAFNADTWTFSCNTVDEVEFGFFQKDPPDSSLPNGVVKGNLFKKFQKNSSAAGSPIALLVAGGESPGVNKVAICYNVHAGDLETGTRKSAEMIYLHPDSGVEQSQYVDIWNNVSIGGEGLLNMSDTIHVRTWNNIVQSATSNIIKIADPQSGNLSKLELSDYHYLVGGTQSFRTHYVSATVTYTFANWKLATTGSDNYLSNSNPDTHSTSTSTPPSYADQANFNYSWLGAVGLAGQYIGVGELTSVGREAWF